MGEVMDMLDTIIRAAKRGNDKPQKVTLCSDLHAKLLAEANEFAKFGSLLNPAAKIQNEIIFQGVKIVCNPAMPERARILTRHGYTELRW